MKKFFKKSSKTWFDLEHMLFFHNGRLLQHIMTDSNVNHRANEKKNREHFNQVIPLRLLRMPIHCKSRHMLKQVLSLTLQ